MSRLLKINGRDISAVACDASRALSWPLTAARYTSSDVYIDSVAGGGGSEWDGGCCCGRRRHCSVHTVLTAAAAAIGSWRAAGATDHWWIVAK